MLRTTTIDTPTSFSRRPVPVQQEGAQSSEGEDGRVSGQSAVVSAAALSLRHFSGGYLPRRSSRSCWFLG